MFSAVGSIKTTQVTFEYRLIPLVSGHEWNCRQILTCTAWREISPSKNSLRHHRPLYRVSKDLSLLLSLQFVMLKEKIYMSILSYCFMDKRIHHVTIPQIHHIIIPQICLHHIIIPQTKVQHTTLPQKAHHNNRLWCNRTQKLHQRQLLKENQNNVHDNLPIQSPAVARESTAMITPPLNLNPRVVVP